MSDLLIVAVIVVVAWFIVAFLLGMMMGRMLRLREEKEERQQYCPVCGQPDNIGDCNHIPAGTRVGKIYYLPVTKEQP